ncbi:hypothetical protein HOY80DRAFT_1010988 [Tuber brumale]|nr:hypothetical protein HOY80DRAFT_1010988 [Tuber brumale]
MHFSKVSVASALLALLPVTIASPYGLFSRDSSTGRASRSKPGNIPYGANIYNCLVAGTVAVTYDDGPYIYTNEVLDLFKQFDAKATFFVTGNNLGKGAINNEPWAGMIRRMESEGHQIASHTWTHQDLSAISEAARRDEMLNNEAAIRSVIGKYPTYMRPPYSSCTVASGCVNTMNDLGYHIIYFDVDTDDYNNDTPATIQNAKNNFSRAFGGRSAAQDDFLAIAHDIHEQTARSLTRFMLETIKNNGYRAVTVGECFGDAKDNWYRT